MTDLSTNDVHSRTITALFDTREAAQTAVNDLVTAGVPREHVRLTEGSSGTAGTTAAAATHDSRGFWDELKDMFLPNEDRYGYAEGLSRGGHLLAVRSDEANYTRVMTILDRDGAIDMDEREASWRSEGWSGYDANTTGTTLSQTATTPRATTTGLTDRTTTASTAGAGTAALATGAALGAGSASTTARTADTTATTPVGDRMVGDRMAGAARADTLREGAEEVIPVYEETARVGKRDVDHGRVRLRSYVVEVPFSEQVNLRAEQVQVERHPVNRPVGVGEAVFQDRVIEAEEHAEEAVLAKEARLKEEISLRKTVETRSETVQDTLRRTEVEVEDTRSGHAVAPTAGVAGATGALGQVDTSRIGEHMPVLASDGTQIGTVDHMEGTDRIKLTKNSSPDGQHHFIPLSWVERVDTHVHLKQAAAYVRANW